MGIRPVDLRFTRTSAMMKTERNQYNFVRVVTCFEQVQQLQAINKQLHCDHALFSQCTIHPKTTWNYCYSWIRVQRSRCIRAQGQTQMQTQEADGLSVWCVLVPKGVGIRIVVDRQKAKTRSESRRYRVAGRLEVRASRLVRQAGTESRKQARVKTGRTSK